MLVHQGLSELLLIISQLILVEIELLVCGDIRRDQFFGENCFRVDSADPRMEQNLFEPFHAAKTQFGVFIEQSS